MFKFFRRKPKKKQRQTIPQLQKAKETKERQTIPSLKHKAPSRQRYETAHPTIAFRLDADLKESFLAYLSEKRQTPTQFIRQTLEAPVSKPQTNFRIPLDQQTKLAYEAGKREGEKGKQEAYERGKGEGMLEGAKLGVDSYYEALQEVMKPAKPK